MTASVQGRLNELRDLLGDTDPARRVEDRVPVLGPLEGLFGPGLRRGSVVAVEGKTARHTLALALLAGVSAAGGWCGVVGVPALGCAAAAELGVRLDRLALVPRPGAAWAEVVSALCTGMAAVLVCPPVGAVPPKLARRLAARARQSRCTLVTLGPAWEGRDARVSVTGQPRWEGLGAGTGRLRRRRVTVTAFAPGRVTRELWLPAADGGVAVAVPEAVPEVPDVPEGGAPRLVPVAGRGA